MNTKFLAAFFKPLVSFIGWIGGAVGGHYGDPFSDWFSRHTRAS